MLIINMITSFINTNKNKNHLALSSRFIQFPTFANKLSGGAWGDWGQELSLMC